MILRECLAYVVYDLRHHLTISARLRFNENIFRKSKTENNEEKNPNQIQIDRND